MAELKNMKFRVSSPEQSERLQNVLFSLGYKWEWGSGNVRCSTLDKPYLFTYEDGIITFGRQGDTFDTHPHVERDTDAFFERISHNEDNMMEALAKPFKGLEDAYNETVLPEHRSVAAEPATAPWLDNMGEMPVEDTSTVVDVTLRDGFNETYAARGFNWGLQEDSSDIIKWRYHDAAEWFKAPKTPLRVTHTPDGMSDTAKVFMKAAEMAIPAIDTHYNFSYTLTEKNIEVGTLRLDPYFVSQQWQLGSKDSTGVIFHLLKTIARFGDKNSKEREINALHKSVLRLAQLEGVELK